MSRLGFIAVGLAIAACGARSELGVPEYVDAAGEDANDEPGPDAVLAPLLAVDGEHGCYRRRSGELVCWGHGPNGEYAPDGGRPVVAFPEHVPTSGVPHTIAAHITGNSILLADGTVDAWGYDDVFQRLGDGSGKPQPAPGVAVFTSATELIGNPMGDFICARRADGSLYCWGYPPVCTPTFPDAGYPATPAPRPDLATLDTIAIGQNFLCGTKNGAMLCCGQQGDGDLGDGVTQPGFRDDLESVKLPPTVRSARAFTGLAHACALTIDATIWCWGWNNYGQVGDGTGGNDQPIPVPVAGLSNVAQLALGQYHSCARLTDGSVRCWGKNDHGQLGDGSTVQRLTPVAVVSSDGSGLLSNVVDLHAAWDFSCALLASGEVYCWGWNQHGQLGDGTTVDRHVPTKVAGLP